MYVKKDKDPKKQIFIWFEKNHISLLSTQVRLLSNLVHINKEAQNYLADNNQLIPVLSFTSISCPDSLAREVKRNKKNKYSLKFVLILMIF